MSDSNAAVESTHSVECCGERHMTKFCPHCGKAIQGHNLYSLLRHCEVNLRQSQKMQEEARAWNNERHIESAQRSIDKWQVWTDSLRDVLENQDE